LQFGFTAYSLRLAVGLEEPVAKFHFYNTERAQRTTKGRSQEPESRSREVRGRPSATAKKK